MKKTIIWTLFLILVSTSLSADIFAMSPEEAKKARYEEVRKIKEEQRAAREAEKADPQAAAVKKEPGFWEKEGERSGLGGSQNRIGSFVKNLNPVPFFKNQQEKYNARKAVAQGQQAATAAK